MINIFVIDDCELIIRGFKHSFRSTCESIHVVGSAQDIGSAVDTIKKCIVDIIILDLYLGKSNPINNITKIKESFPAIPIVILSSETSTLWKFKSLQAGVKGYLTKDEDMSIIKETLLLISNGKLVVPRVLDEKKEKTMTVLNSSYYSKTLLNQKELVFDVSNGLSIKEIAIKLNRTISAIEKKLMDLRKAYKAKSNAELVKIFIRNWDI